MPALESKVPELTPKRLNRKLTRSANVFTFRKSDFYSAYLPKVRRLAINTHDRIVALPADVDPKVITALNASFAQLVELEHRLLGFDKRKPAEEVRAVPTIHHTPVQDVQPVQSVHVAPEKPATE